MAEQKLQTKMTMVFDAEKEITPEQEEDLKKRLQSTIVLFFPEVSKDTDILVVPRYKKQT
jgi:hypothetical protein